MNLTRKTLLCPENNNVSQKSRIYSINKDLIEKRPPQIFMFLRIDSCYIGRILVSKNNNEFCFNQNKKLIGRVPSES